MLCAGIERDEIVTNISDHNTVGIGIDKTCPTQMKVTNSPSILLSDFSNVLLGNSLDLDIRLGEFRIWLDSDLSLPSFDFSQRFVKSFVDRL